MKSEMVIRCSHYADGSVGNALKAQPDKIIIGAPKTVHLSAYNDLVNGEII